MNGGTMDSVVIIGGDSGSGWFTKLFILTVISKSRVNLFWAVNCIVCS